MMMQARQSHHAVMVADAAGNALGRYRHLLFDISRTANRAE